jgi:hypothetical protein
MMLEPPEYADRLPRSSCSDDVKGKRIGEPRVPAAQATVARSHRAMMSTIFLVIGSTSNKPKQNNQLKAKLLSTKIRECAAWRSHCTVDKETRERQRSFR